MDNQGYPTQEELDKITSWPISGYLDIKACLDWIGENCWHFSDWGWHSDKDVYKVSTGGWSGNEEVIATMRSNYLLWSLSFVQHKRGGHYILESSPYAYEELELKKDNEAM